MIRFVIGGLENNPTTVDLNDGGGPTRFGITSRHNPGVNVNNLTQQRAEQIAREQYWNPVFDQVDPRVAAIAFDSGWVAGRPFGVELARRYPNDPAGALEAYRSHLASIARNSPRHRRFARGWNNRVNRLETYISGREGR